MRNLSPNTLLCRIGALGALLVGGGCAKYPDGGSGATTTRLTFSITTDGPVRFGTEPGAGGTPYIYMIAIQTSPETNPTTGGPIPVISPPWGNGFVAGGASHFIWWDPTQSSSQYTLYRFTNPTLQQWTATGIPVNVVVANPGDKTLKCEVDLSQLEPDPVARGLIKSIQVNFLTMDRIPLSGTSKAWDALGNSLLPGEVNSWVTIPITSDRVVSNTSVGNLEIQGDQAEPALDLVDWRVEVSVR